MGSAWFFQCLLGAYVQILISDTVCGCLYHEESQCDVKANDFEDLTPWLKEKNHS